MGFQDAAWGVRFSRAYDGICRYFHGSHYYYAIDALATGQDRRYASFSGSLWSRGILPIDSVKIQAERGEGYLDVDMSSKLD